MWLSGAKLVCRQTASDSSSEKGSGLAEVTPAFGAQFLWKRDGALREPHGAVPEGCPPTSVGSCCCGEGFQTFLPQRPFLQVPRTSVCPGHNSSTEA